MSDSSTSNMETPEIKPWKISKNSNGHKFSHGCPFQAYNISIRSKLNIGNSREIKNGHNFSQGCLIRAHNMSRVSKLNNGSSWEIQMVITFHTDVRFRQITYRDAQNWTTEALEKFKWSWHLTRMSNLGASHIVIFEIEQRKLSSNSNGHNFSHWGPIHGYNISIRSKLNIGNSREIQMAITFHTDVRFGRIICREARNWTTEALEKFKWS